MSEIRNQLKNQNLEAVLPASLAQVGGQVFPDEPSIQDQLDFAQIVRTWSSVHAPTYGNPIGSTSSTITKAGAAGEAEDHCRRVGTGIPQVLCVLRHPER